MIRKLHLDQDLLSTQCLSSNSIYSFTNFYIVFRFLYRGVCQVGKTSGNSDESRGKARESFLRAANFKRIRHYGKSKKMLMESQGKLVKNQKIPCLKFGKNPTSVILRATKTLTWTRP